MSSLVAPRRRVSSDFALRDGTLVTIRELRGEDRKSLEEFVDKLSEETIYYRFLATGIDREVLISELSPKPQCYILVAVKDGSIVGHSAYFRAESETAEVGLLILETYQGLGLGTGLTERIAEAANQEGISMFEAIIGWNNTKMIRMLRNMGFPTSEKVEPDVIRIRFPTSIDPVSLAEFQEKWVFKPDC
jgi:acetyltransferase